ncbi:hypothetical protein HMN09_00307600 [Mycena chlorophos]|uniref:Uncharacterized protein n=1 Tax=Mycena chlorophos TaxID=658473 RepID=A0A8H6WJA3_MYCCL|nr:hypothetical protein HMN09_00307600 [Mycena chlorophos]
MGGGGLLEVEVVREDSRARRQHPQGVGFFRTPSAPRCAEAAAAALKAGSAESTPVSPGPNSPFPRSKNYPPPSFASADDAFSPWTRPEIGISHTSHGRQISTWTQLDNPETYGSETLHPAVPSLGLALCEWSPDISPPLSNENVLKRFTRFGHEMSPWARFWPSSSGATMVARSGAWDNTAYTRICSPHHPTTSPYPLGSLPKRFSPNQAVMRVSSRWAVFHAPEDQQKPLLCTKMAVRSSARPRTTRVAPRRHLVTVTRRGRFLSTTLRPLSAYALGASLRASLLPGRRRCIRGRCTT